jgi:hypothetical protein
LRIRIPLHFSIRNPKSTIRNRKWGDYDRWSITGNTGN